MRGEGAEAAPRGVFRMFLGKVLHAGVAKCVSSNSLWGRLEAVRPRVVQFGQTLESIVAQPSTRFFDPTNSDKLGKNIGSGGGEKT